MQQHERAKEYEDNRVPFTQAVEIIPIHTAERIIRETMQQWQAPNQQTAESWCTTLYKEFPDTAATDSFWHEASDLGFRDFFSWGHDHDFGFGVSRTGAMGSRHLEIASESLSRGMLQQDLGGKKVLDIGCWSGGDLLLLAGLGAKVTAIEEHPRSAASARRLCELVGCPATIHEKSLYHDQQEWKQQFDVVYCSGVIYHVTDPVLFLRICFAYLKVGGTLIIETKSHAADRSVCSYSGSLEKGWNWFAPSREALGRWMVDAGFAVEDVRLYQRPIGRLLAYGHKQAKMPLPETAGFSRPRSWLEGLI